MKNLSENKRTGNASLKSTKTIAPLKSRRKPDFFIPAASKLDELYMDVQQVALELNISKRTIRNMRKSGKLSYTSLHVKIFYYTQELFDILEGNKVPKNDHIALKKIRESIQQNKTNRL
jgi:hypothetical protein